MASTRVGDTSRTRLRHRVDRLLKALGAGTGWLVVVTGEAGVGKTWLVRELLATRDGLMVAWGSGVTTSTGNSLRPWLQAVSALDEGGSLRDALHDLDASGVDQHGRPSTDGLDRVARALKELAATTALVVVLDALDEADETSRELLAWLAPQLPAIGVGVIATARDDRRPDDARAPVPDMLGRLGEPVRLDGMTVGELAALASDMLGGPVTPGVVAMVHHRTAGNVRLATALLEDLAAHGLAGDDDAASHRVPRDVRASVGRRLARLDEPTACTLECAAVLGTGGTVEHLHRMVDLAAAAGLVASPVGGGLDVAAGLEASGLVRVEDSRWSFRHGVVRDVVETHLPVSRRRHLHRLAADSRREGGRVDPVRVAHHLVAAGGPGARSGAARVLRDAAARSRAAGDVETAVAVLREAIRLLTDPVEPGDDVVLAGLQVELGEALLVANQPGQARAAHEAAALAATAAGDHVLLARAALGVGAGHVGLEVPMLDRHQQDLLTTALAALPDDELVWQALVRARLSVALTFEGDDVRREHLADTAVDLARRAGDAEALATALAARCDVRAGPEHAEERENAATEILALARGRHEEDELLGHRLRLVARLEQGDIHGAESDRDAFAALAQRVPGARFAWYSHLWRAAWHLLHGRQGQAARSLERAWELGRQVGSDHVEPLCMTHQWWALVEQGDHAGLASLLDALDDMPAVPWVRVALALGLAESNRHNAAVVQLDAVAASLGDVPPDAEWLPMFAQVAHVVGIVGGHPVARTAYEALSDHRHRHVVEGIAAALQGSVERPLGVLAAALGDPGGADRHFVAAEAANRRLGGAALVARTLRDGGVALDDPARLEEAASIYGELGWQRRVDEVGNRRRALGGASALAGRRAGNRVVVPKATLRREADGWCVGWQDATTMVADLKGLHDLARLVDRPGREVPALDLVAAGREPRAGGMADHRERGIDLGLQGDVGPALDDEARQAYRARLADLDDDVQRARAANDPAAAERAEAERDALTSALLQAYGLGGRPRRAGDPAERARTTVTSRIRDAITRVAKVDAALGRHLDNSIRTGRLCSYSPEMPVDWTR